MNDAITHHFGIPEINDREKQTCAEILGKCLVMRNYNRYEAIEEGIRESGILDVIGSLDLTDEQFGKVRDAVNRTSILLFTQGEMLGRYAKL